MSEHVFPLILETGIGVDLHGADPTKAAVRAVEDTIRRVSFPGLAAVLPGGDRASMRVDVTVAVPDPTAVDTDAVKAVLPYGRITVTAVTGGLIAPNGMTDDDGRDGRILIAVVLIAVGW